MILAGTMMITVSCAAAPSVLAPASESALKTNGLTWIVFAIAAVVFVVVEALLIYAAVRFRRAGQSDLPKQIEGNQRLEIGWTLLPLIVLLIVFFLSLSTLQAIRNQPAFAAGASMEAKPLTVRVVGHQWWWEFDYPDLKIVTANELHIPAGMQVNLDIESIDVIHSFWVPQLGGKTDAIPGHVNQSWIKAIQPGTYEGQCAEFCGVEHGLMRLRVIVETPDQFQAWVTKQQAPLPSFSQAEAQGEQLFLTKGCVACHTIQGTTAQGKIGPDLTHLASRSVMAGAIMDRNLGTMENWLADPQAVKPGNLMPNLHLTQDEITKLGVFLERLK